MYAHVSLIIYPTLSIFLHYSFEPFRFLNPIVLVLACHNINPLQGCTNVKVRNGYLGPYEINFHLFQILY